MSAWSRWVTVCSALTSKPQPCFVRRYKYLVAWRNCCAIPHTAGHSPGEKGSTFDIACRRTAVGTAFPTKALVGRPVASAKGVCGNLTAARVCRPCVATSIGPAPARNTWWCWPRRNTGQCGAGQLARYNQRLCRVSLEAASSAGIPANKTLQIQTKRSDWQGTLSLGCSCQANHQNPSGKNCLFCNLTSGSN